MASLILSDLVKTLKSTFGINRATVDASGLTAARTITLPDASMIVAGKDLAQTFSAIQTFSAKTVHTPVTLTDAATIATDAALSNRFEVSSATDCTLGAPTNPTHGQQCVWRWKNTDSNPHTLSLGSGTGGFRYGSDITTTNATAASKADFITAIYHSTDNKWDVVSIIKGF